MDKEGTEQVNEFLSKYGKDVSKRSFDLVMVFSVTMWIHLNRGDAGLEEFLGFSCRASRNILLEPQPWKCYQVIFCFVFLVGMVCFFGGDFVSVCECCVVFNYPSNWMIFCLFKF